MRRYACLNLNSSTQATQGAESSVSLQVNWILVVVVIVLIVLVLVSVLYINRTTLKKAFKRGIGRAEGEEPNPVCLKRD